MKWLKKFLINRKKTRAKEDFRNGFKWAMGAYYVDHLSLDKIEAYIDDDQHPFDKGVEAAVKIILFGGLPDCMQVSYSELCE